jgi:uncharacterized protein (DUF58 family)
MRPGRIVVALFLLAGLSGTLISGSALAARLLYLGLLLSVGGWFWTRAVGSSLHLQRSARALRASVGDVLVEHFELHNSSRLMAPWVEIENNSTLPSSAGSRLLTVLGGRRNQSYLARTWLRRRGSFALGPTRVTTGDPLGLFRVSVQVPARQSLTVLPMLFGIESFLAPVGLLPGGQVARGKAQDVTPHAAGVREYAHGDPMKRIHWPTSLRRRQLMVKEFEQDPQAETWLVLDAQAGVHAETPDPSDEAPVEGMLFGRRPKFALPCSTLEYAVSLAASLAHYFIQQRRAVGLLTAGRTYTVISAERSSRQESKILQTLAFVEAEGNMSVAGLLSAQASQFPQGSTVILITTSLAEDILIGVSDLQRRNLQPVVILLAAETFGASWGKGAAFEQLRDRRVPVCRISYGDDLRLQLMKFSATRLHFDQRTWQRPPSLR